MSKWIELARPIREAMNGAGAVLTDAQASEYPAIYPAMQYDGALIQAGTRILWGGVLKRAAVDLWDREENNPDNAPALWENILYRDGIRIIPDPITAGTAFAKDELGWWGDSLYKSINEGLNVWTPEEYPAGWELVTN